MVVINKVDRSEHLCVGSETDVLWSMLDYHRSTLLWKCAGLDEEQLRRRSVTPSALSLFELLQHLTSAERYWFQECLLGSSLEPLYSTTPEGEIDPLDPTPVEDVVRHFLATCQESRRIVAVHSLDEIVPSQVWGSSVSLRFIAMHMVEEYARHCGHADLLREAIDGAVGE